jgi:hypothetical protein
MAFFDFWNVGMAGCSEPLLDVEDTVVLRDRKLSHLHDMDLSRILRGLIISTLIHSVDGRF